MDNTENMDAFNYPLILHCEAMKQGESTENRYALLVAASADNSLNLDQQISVALAQQGYIFLYSEQPIAANNFFQKNVANSSLAMTLCHQLSADTPLVFQQIAVLHQPSKVDQQAEYVQIKTLSTPKNIDQQHLAFWEREWINPELKALLFGHCLTPEHQQQKQHTYLIVDASAYIEQRGVFDLDLISDCPVMCMFTGDAAENLKMVAPYLLDITLDAAAYNDDQRVSHFHKRYFETMWGEDVGIIIQSTAPMQVIHQHFRKFLKLTLPNANDRFFRFWDPRVLKVHLPTLADYHRASSKFFCLPNDRYPPVTFIYENHQLPHTDGDKNQQSEKLRPINCQIATFVSSAFSHMQQNIEQHGQSVNPVEDIPLEQIITKSFTLHKTRQFCQKTAAWLVDSYGEKSFEGMSISEFLLSQIAPLKNGLSLKLEYEVKCALAGCYLLETAVSALPARYLQYLQRPDLVAAQRAEMFLEAIQQEILEQRGSAETSLKKELT